MWYWCNSRRVPSQDICMQQLNVLPVASRRNTALLTPTSDWGIFRRPLHNSTSDTGSVTLQSELQQNAIESITIISMLFITGNSRGSHISANSKVKLKWSKWWHSRENDAILHSAFVTSGRSFFHSKWNMVCASGNRCYAESVRTLVTHQMHSTTFVTMMQSAMISHFSLETNRGNQIDSRRMNKLESNGSKQRFGM